MSRRGVEFTLEFEGIHEKDLNDHTDMCKDIQRLIDISDFPITEVGLTEDTDNFIIRGKIISFTKKETDAKYTAFKSQLKQIFKSYRLNFKAIDRLLAYFKTLY